MLDTVVPYPQNPGRSDMRSRWLLCLPAVVLAWLPQTAPAAGDPSPAPVAGGASVVVLPAPSAPPPAVAQACGCSAAWGFVGYGFEPARGLTVHRPRDNVAGLIWRGYVGHVAQGDLGPIGGCGTCTSGCRR
jgi:hypothetical protein